MKNPLDERYENDQTFRQVVDLLQSVLLQNMLAPSELRTAATYAAIRYEMLNCRQHYVYDERSGELFAAHNRTVRK